MLDAEIPQSFFFSVVSTKENRTQHVGISLMLCA